MVIKTHEVGIYPLILALPFMYFPKILPGDTQPWILIAGVFAFLTFRTRRFVVENDLPLILAAFLCILVYFLRNDSLYENVRNTYTYLTFIILWMVCQRENGDYFSKAVKLTIVIWFLVGLYQFVGDKLGFHIEVSGRWYKIVKQGPPSLTAEASFYGSISVVCIMYLLSENNPRNLKYIVLALLSIFISGSFLSILLLVFPLMRLPFKYKLLGILLVPVFIYADYYFGFAGVSTRLDQIFYSGVSVQGMFQDPSLNLRAGHIYFTLYYSLFDSLFFLNELDFMGEYNEFSRQSMIFIETGSPYIVTALGEMFYGGGILALFILVPLLWKASKTCTSVGGKFEKLLFIIACMLNPISISNPFLILYIFKKDEKK